MAESREIPDATDTISRPPDTPLYLVLEGPARTDTIRDQALSVHNEQSSERFRSDSDYDEPVLKEACAAIRLPSKGRKKEAVYENQNPKRLTDAASSSDILDDNDEYCYSYTTAVQNVPLKDEKGGPKTDGILYQSLDGPNTEYQALESTPAPTNGYTPMEGITELNAYQPLQKSTRLVYQPASSSDLLDHKDEYCYSYTTAVQNVLLKDEKGRPKTDGLFYQSLDGPNTGYQALESTPAPTNGYTPMEGITELSGYQPLQKSTRSVYQPLRKTTESPRRAFNKK